MVTAASASPQDSELRAELRVASRLTRISFSFMASYMLEATVVKTASKWIVDCSFMSE